MQEDEIKEFVQRMRNEGLTKSPILSGHVNVLLRGGKINVLYKYLSDDIYMNLIILRAIAKQHLKLNRIFSLKIGSLNCGFNDAVLNMYKASVLANTEESLETFVKAADLILSIIE